LPVDPDAVADLAAEQLIAGHAQRFRFHIEQSVFDRSESKGHHAAGSRARCGEQLGIDAFVLESVLADHARRQPLDRGGHARRAEALVILAPADDAVVADNLDEVVVAPAGVAGKGFDAFDGRLLAHVSCPVLLSVSDNNRGRRAGQLRAKAVRASMARPWRRRRRRVATGLCAIQWQYRSRYVHTIWRPDCRIPPQGEFAMSAV